jgi:hypothetical protein
LEPLDELFACEGVDRISRNQRGLGDQSSRAVISVVSCTNTSNRITLLRPALSSLFFAFLIIATCHTAPVHPPLRRPRLHHSLAPSWTQTSHRRIIPHHPNGKLHRYSLRHRSSTTPHRQLHPARLPLCSCTWRGRPKVRLKPFSVPSMSVSMSGRKTRRGKGSSRSSGDFVGTSVGGGVGGSVRPKDIRIDETRCQRLPFKVKVVI